jgi:hypothetical protein
MKVKEGVGAHSGLASGVSMALAAPLHLNISWQEQTLHRSISVKPAAKKDAAAVAAPLLGELLLVLQLQPPLPLRTLRLRLTSLLAARAARWAQHLAPQKR